MDAVHRKGGLAPDVSIEVDGGSENQNKTVFALCADLVLRGCTKRITLYRLPIHHTHNVLDARFGQLSQCSKGKEGLGKTRHSLGQGAMCQQDWDKCAENTLKTVDVKVVNTRCLYDWVKHYEDCVDPQFNGYGPGTPIRVIEITLGPSTKLFPEGEPLIRYKLAAQYEAWYPNDPKLSTQGVPIFTKRPPTCHPNLKALDDWEQFSVLRERILEDSQNLKFFEPRHHEQWEEWFAAVPLRLADIEPEELPFLQFPEARKVKYEVKVSHRHKEKALDPKDQPLQWSGNNCREGPLKKPRQSSSLSSSKKKGKSK